MVQIAISRGGEFKGAEADIVQGLVIDAIGLVRVLNELMDGEGGVVGLDNGVGDLGRGDNGEGVHDTVGVLLTDLGDQECAHTGSGATTERVGQLEALKKRFNKRSRCLETHLETIAGLGLLADNVQDGVNELGALSVVTLGPVVAGARLAKDEVVGAEDLAEGAGAD